MTTLLYEVALFTNGGSRYFAIGRNPVNYRQLNDRKRTQKGSEGP